MSGPINPVFQHLNQPEVQRTTFHTPLQNFEMKYDHLHRHHYPGSHQDNQWGAKLNHIDLDTGVKRGFGNFEMNTNMF